MARRSHRRPQRRSGQVVLHTGLTDQDMKDLFGLTDDDLHCEACLNRAMQPTYQDGKLSGWTIQAAPKGCAAEE